MSRSICLRVAEMLRGGAPAVELIHKHSILSRWIRLQFLESEFNFALSIGYMQSWGAIHARNDVELSKVGEGLKKLMFSAEASFPYMTGGQTADGMMNDERLKAIEKYNKYRERVLGGAVQQDKV